jgi:hypothetical protein
LDVVGCASVEGEEGFAFLADEHETVVVVGFVVGGELDVGDDVVVILVLYGREGTCSSLVLNHSRALPSLTGICSIINTTIK